MVILNRRTIPLAARAVASATAGAAPAAGGGGGLGPLALSAAIFGGANALGAGISLVTGSHLHLDLIGTGVFAVSALALRGTTLRQNISAGMVTLWSTKLAGFLFYRALQTRHDGRLDELLSSAGGTLTFWWSSFWWGWLVSLPHTLAAAVPRKSLVPFGTPFDYVGIGAFAVGLILETAADAQKWRFKADPANRGAFCDVGVWKLSQHPNYLGNLLMWSGITLFHAPSLVAAGAAGGATGLARWGRLLGAACSPLFLFLLFWGQASGAITNTVELANAKYGADKRYLEYVKATPLIFPTMRSIGEALRGARAKGA